LALGAALRHHGAGLLVHISMAAVVLLAAVVVGVRAWGPVDRPPLIRRLGVVLLVAVAIQVVLGLGALIAVGTSPGAESSGALRAALATPHQVMGAVLFGLAVALVLWERRLVHVERAT
jgi:heme A synthase